MLSKLLIVSLLFTLSMGNGSPQIGPKTGILIKQNSRALMASKTQPWQGFMEGSSGCISVIKNGLICGWTAVSAGFKCVWSYIRCIIPKCGKCCAGGWFSWLCVPCRCKWNCSSKTCKQEFRKVGKACKITADDCIRAFNHLGKATKKFFTDVANGIKFIANKIAHAAKWVAEKAWAAVKWVWDQIKKLLDLIKIFEVAKAIGNAFKCFGKLGSKSDIESASKNAGNVKGVAESQGKKGIISKIDGFIPGFKAFVCCLQSTAIGRVLNKWGKSLLNFHKNWKGLKVGSFIDDPAIVVSLAASAFAGYSAGTSLDIAFSTAFNVGLYWTICGGFVTDIGVGVSVVVNLFRKWSMIPGESVAISFSVGIPDTPIGVGVGVVLPIGNNSIDFGAVNVEVGASNGVSPVSVGGHVCHTRELVSFNLLELLGNILTANNECPSKLPATPATSSGGSATSQSSSSSEPETSGSTIGGSGGVGATKTVSSSSNLYSSRVSDGYFAWTGFQTTLTGSVAKINVQYKWKDQGWGNRKGHIYLYAYNGSTKIETLTIATGVAPHSWTNVNYNVPTSQLSNLKKGILLKLMYRVGGGGGHRLYVNNFKATITYRPVATPSVKTSSGSNLYSTRRSDSYYHCCFSTTMTRRVSAIKVSYTWKDQGWGNRKGHIYLYAYQGSSKVATLTIASGVAPHKWTNVNYNVPSSQLGNLKSGTVLKLYYRVGGGGGHRLYVNNFKVTFYYTGLKMTSPVIIEANENIEAFENMAAMEENRRLMVKTILSSHKQKIIQNNEMNLRQSIADKERRRLETELKETEEARDAMENTRLQGEEVDLSNQPKLDKPLPVIADPCDVSNTSGEEAILKGKGFDKLSVSVIASKYCTKTCQHHNPGSTESDDCTDYRGALCMKGGFGIDLNSISKCCNQMMNDPENLWFRVRKFCAQHALVTKPTKQQFCNAASKSASSIQKDFNIINTIMDGCAENFDVIGCKKLRGQQTAVDLARVANGLCKNSLDQVFGVSTQFAVGIWVTLVGIVGVLTLKNRYHSKKQGSYYGYEALV